MSDKLTSDDINPKFWQAQVAERDEEIDKLRSIIKVYEEALKIYAKPPMWISITDKENDCSALGIKHLCVEYEPFKIAKEALEKVKKLK